MADPKAPPGVLELAAIIAAIYELHERVESHGGPVSIAGVAAAHTMHQSLKKNKARAMTVMRAAVNGYEAGFRDGVRAAAVPPGARPNVEGASTV